MTSPKKEGLFFTLMRLVEGILALLRALIVPKILGATYYGVAHIFAMIGFFRPFRMWCTFRDAKKNIEDAYF